MAVEPRVYRLPPGDRFAPVALPAMCGVLFNPRLVSVASDEGVRPAARKPRMVPWQEISLSP